MGQLIDAVMLMGGAFARPNGEAPALVLSRSRSQSKLLAWAVVLLEQHGIPMSLAASDATISSKVVYKSRGNVLFGRAARRWYQDGSQAITPQIHLDEPTFAMWCIDALVRGGGAGEVRLTCPGLGASVARDLCRQVDALGWRASVQGDDRPHLVIAQVARATLDQWMASYVPPSLWS